MCRLHGKPSQLLSILICSLLGGCPSMTDGTDTNNDVVDHRGDGSVVTVDIRNFSFEDKKIRIQIGQTVRWTNHDPVEHTVTSGNPGDADAGSVFDSGQLAINDEFEFMFSEVGDYSYFCIPHASMASMRDAHVIVEQ